MMLQSHHRQLSPLAWGDCADLCECEVPKADSVGVSPLHLYRWQQIIVPLK